MGKTLPSKLFHRRSSNPPILVGLWVARKSEFPPYRLPGYQLDMSLRNRHPCAAGALKKKGALKTSQSKIHITVDGASQNSKVCSLINHIAKFSDDFIDIELDAQARETLVDRAQQSRS